MKKYIAAILIFPSFSVLSSGQSNSFPSSGNAGIGTTSPASHLDITSSSPGFFLTPSSYSGSYRTQFGVQSGAKGVLIFGNNGVNEIRFGNTASGGVGAIFVNNTQSYTSATDGILSTYFAANGSVGIGTATPGYLLDVNGSGRFTDKLTGTDATFALTTGNGFIIKGVSATPPNLAYLSNNYFPKFFTRSDQNYGISIFDESTATAIQSADLVNGNSPQSLLFNPFGGNVGIGTATPSEKLSVNGNVSAKKMIVTQTGWSDYVFNDGYKLRSLSSLETYLKKNKHLPEVPSAKEVEEKGLSVGDNQALLLKKIEELTLYMIEVNKKVATQNSKIIQLEKNFQKTGK